MKTILYLLLTLLLLSIMVVIHELGHFLFAKLFRVTVLEFSVGMGPAIFTTKKKKVEQSDEASNGEALDTSAFDQPFEEQKTAFSIRALPIGGYVSMAGEDDSSDDVNAFCNKPVWQRILITLAGPVMNILLGVICTFALVGMDVSEYDGHLASNTVAGFQDYSVSDKGEDPLMAGDKIIKVDGVRVWTGNEIKYEIMNSGYEPIDLVVERNGERITLENVKFLTQETSGATFGSHDFIFLAEKADFGSFMRHSVCRSFSTIKIIIDGLKDILTGRYGMDAVSGPVGMAGVVSDVAKDGISSLLFLFILITMNLGVFNLIPLPALDGGRLVFNFIELIFRKPVKKEVEQIVNTVGLLLLMALMLFVTAKDIFNLF